MTLSEAIQIAYAQTAFDAKPLTGRAKLERNLALAIVATWSASCSDTYMPLAPYWADEKAAQRALDAYDADHGMLDLPAYC